MICIIIYKPIELSKLIYLLKVKLQGKFIGPWRLIALKLLSQVIDIDAIYLAPQKSIFSVNIYSTLRIIRVEILRFNMQPNRP